VANSFSVLSRKRQVYAPPGTFLTGGLELKSRVTLYLEAGCVLLGSKSFDDYDYHPGPPMQGDANGHYVIFAQNAEDVTLCGPGTIDGQGEAYWELRPNRQPVAPEDAWKEGATGHYQVKDKPPPFSDGRIRPVPQRPHQRRDTEEFFGMDAMSRCLRVRCHRRNPNS
jgi:hypothetical protein